MNTRSLQNLTVVLSIGAVFGLTPPVLAEEKKDLESLAAELKKAVAAGEISEEEATAKYFAAAGEEKEKSAKGEAKGSTGKKEESAELAELEADLKEAVASGKLTKEDAVAKYKAAAGKKAANQKEKGGDDGLAELVWSLLQAVESEKLTAEEAMAKYKYVVDELGDGEKLKARRKGKGKGAGGKNVEALKQLGKTLPKTSTAGEKEGPASTFIFGWAANATHRFMDNSHVGDPRKINGISFRLDHRDHDAIARTWEKVTVRVAHGDWSSLKYNKSTDFKLVDDPVTAFDQRWSFPGLKGFPPLEPASWGGPQNSLSFRFDEPFAYNGKDAIYVEFKFSGGTADDGREWEGELPEGFEYHLDSMPEVGGWREAVADGREGAIYTGPARVATATSYTAGGQSVWTSSPKGLPYIKWDVEKE